MATIFLPLTHLSFKLAFISRRIVQAMKLDHGLSFLKQTFRYLQVRLKGVACIFDYLYIPDKQ